MHFALICPPFKSHVAVFSALASELSRRGHRATFILNEGAEAHLQGESYVSVAGTDKTHIERIARHAADPGGPVGILRTVADSAMLSDRLCEHAPAHLRMLGADAILGDQMEPAAGLLSRHLRLPMLSIACALPIEQAPHIPLPFLPWAYEATEWGEKRNRGGERVAQVLLTAQRRVITKWSRVYGLIDRLDDLQSCLSPLGTISQTIDEFDFPRPASQRALHAVGPIRDETIDCEHSYPVSADRPFVFMSLGTLQGHRHHLFRTVALACQRANAQLLVAHCGGLSQHQAESLGATWATDFAPQRAVLRRADLCITHGGLNTVMDALASGTPLLALPIAFDQPGVAARIVYRRVGQKLSRHLLSVNKMQKAITTILNDENYRLRARQIGRSVASAGGLKRAVDVIEATLVREAA